MKVYVGPYYRVRGVKKEEPTYEPVCPGCKRQKQMGFHYCPQCGVESSKIGSHTTGFTYPEIPGLMRDGSCFFPPGESECVVFSSFDKSIDLRFADDQMDRFANKYPAPDDAEVFWGVVFWDDE